MVQMDIMRALKTQMSIETRVIEREQASEASEEEDADPDADLDRCLVWEDGAEHAVRRKSSPIYINAEPIMRRMRGAA